MLRTRNSGVRNWASGPEVIEFDKPGTKSAKARQMNRVPGLAYEAEIGGVNPSALRAAIASRARPSTVTSFWPPIIT